MNVGAIKTGALVLGGTVAVGASLGAITALGNEPTAANHGFASHEQRSTVRNSLIGLLGGGAAGFAAARYIPAVPLGPGLGIVVGAAIGAAAAGAFTLGHSIAN